MMNNKQYVATVNVPGYLPMDDEPAVFGSILDAWGYLADERMHGEEDGACFREHGCQWAPGKPYTSTVQEIQTMTTVGTVKGDTPGYHGDHDLGLAYSVSVVESL